MDRVLACGASDEGSNPSGDTKENAKSKIYPVKSSEAGISPTAKLFNRVKNNNSKCKIKKS